MGGVGDKLKSTRARLSSILERHSQLTERLSRDSDRIIFERVQKEFEASLSSQTQEVCLDKEQWNDGLLATIRERVHVEAEREAMRLPEEANMEATLPCNERITYKVGNKVICCLGGSRIGIRYDTYFAGEPCEQYHCVLESKSFLEKMTVREHTFPFFLPILEAETNFLSSNAMKFIDYMGDLVQAYVDRREQARLLKELFGDQITKVYNSLLFNHIDFALEKFDCKITFRLRYADLLSTLPTDVNVVSWPMRKPSTSMTTRSRKGNTSSESQIEPVQLSYAEDVLRTMSLPEAYTEIVLNLPMAPEPSFLPKKA